MTAGSDDVFGSVPALQRASTAEQTANGIRDLILNGQLAPGTPLTEVRLATAFGVSRNTIRETLLLLVREGIVTQHRHRGAVVTTLTIRDIHDLCQARRLLETAAIDASDPVRDADGLKRMEEALAALEAAVELDDWHEIPEADVRFHRALVALLHNRRLESFYAQLETELRFATLVATRWDVLQGQSILDEHRGIYELLRDGRREECRALLLQVLGETEQHLLDSYVARDSTAPADLA